jgi:hypothetical protein
MTHNLVVQLHFARSEFQRAFEGVSEEDALVRLGQMNSLGWIVAHLAGQENRLWVQIAQGVEMEPQLFTLAGYRQPASTPPLAEAWAAWRRVTAAADRYLDALTPQIAVSTLSYQGVPRPENVGNMVLRNIYHYFYHIGEAQAIRQQLHHTNLPEFVGRMNEARWVEGNQ